MGVKGLQSFIKCNPGMAKKIKFSNSSLVIDANNLMCLLFCTLADSRDGEQPRCDIYGGDLVAYGVKVRQFFKSLEKCNITPILVFDGSVVGKKSTQDQLAIKERTIYQRGLERFQMVQNANELAPDSRIFLPQLITNVFKCITSDLGIKKIQAPYEADSHIARVANDLRCPVLTNDSDFLIYPLIVGFMLIDLFDYKNLIQVDDKSYCIDCLLCSQADLVRYVPGLRSETMPLLSILLGNDYVESNTFDRVTESLCVDRHYNGPLKTNTFNQVKIANILTWLKGKTLEEALEYLLGQISPSRRDSLDKALRLLLKSYKIEDIDNFENEIVNIFHSMFSQSDHVAASYLRRLLETTDISSSVLDIVFHNTNYNYPIIDDLSLPSSSIVKYRPYSLAVTLLRARTYQNLTTYRRQIEIGRDTFEIYDRLRGEYTKILIKPMEQLDKFGSLEHLHLPSVITLVPELKKSLLMETFRFNIEELNLMTDTLSRLFKGNYVHESSACFMLIKYIGIETKLAPKPQFIDALLLTFFYHAAIGGLLNHETIQDEHYGQLLLRLRPHAIINNGRQYDQSKPTLYRRIVHFISQLQNAYTVYSLLNGLLDCVFPQPRLELFMNSTLLFRLTKLLRLSELSMMEIGKNIPILNDISGTVKIMVHCDE